MLRLMLVLIVLANAAFFTWSQGWLAPWLPVADSGREPERMAAQLAPERIAVVNPRAPAPGTPATAGAAPGPASAVATACLEAGPFVEGALAGAEAALAREGMPAGAFRREAVPRPSSWLVYMGRFADRAQLRAKADELKRLKLTHRELLAPAALAPGIELARHGDRAAAEAALARYSRLGVRSARVLEFELAPTHWMLRAAAADGELQTRVRSLPELPALGAGVRACAAAPAR